MLLTVGEKHPFVKFQNENTGMKQVLIPLSIRSTQTKRLAEKIPNKTHMDHVSIKNGPIHSKSTFDEAYLELMFSGWTAVGWTAGSWSINRDISEKKPLENWGIKY